MPKHALASFWSIVLQYQGFERPGNAGTIVRVSYVQSFTFQFFMGVGHCHRQTRLFEHGEVINVISKDTNLLFCETHKFPHFRDSRAAMMSNKPSSELVK